MLKPLRTPFARRQRGLSLVELMVGIAVGLLVVAGATMVVANQLGDNRRLLLETQVQQDLRAAADIVTRELRRAGGWEDQARLGLWTSAAPGQLNPQRAVSPSAAPATQVDYQYLRGGVAPQLGFRLNNNGVLQTLLGGAWQDLTDARAVRITAFNVTPVSQVRQPPFDKVPCPSECPGGGTACWPTVTVRELVVDLTGQSVADPAVQRTLSTTVRLRNDLVTGACP